MTPKAEILVVIVMYNGMQWIEKCIGSVRASSVPADIIVIDNGSTDGSVAWLRRSGVELFLCPDNPGFGAANNIGFKTALERGYSYVYLLNQDAWVFPDCFGRLVDAFRRAPAFGILSPVQYDGSGVQLDGNFSRHCAKQLQEGRPNPDEVKFVMAAHWMLTAECIRATGGFSPAFHQYGEDDNYISRARRFGFLTGVVRDAGAVHDRARRKTGRKQKTMLKCIASIKKVCDPDRPAVLSLALELMHLAAMGVYRTSTLPWRSAVQLCRRFPFLKSCRKASLEKGAFL